MSQYTNIYVTSDMKQWHLLYSVCRSSEIAQALNSYLSYERGKELTVSLLSDAIDEIKNHISNIKNSIDDYNKEITLITSCNNSLDDKLEAIREVEQMISESKEDLDWLSYTLHALQFIMCMVNDSNFYTDSDESTLKFYAGIEWNPKYDPIGDE